MTLNTQSLTSLAEVRAFLEGSTAVSFPLPAEAGRYGWLEAITLRPFHDNALNRAGKGVLQVFMRKGDRLYSRAPLTRLIGQWRGRHVLSGCGLIVCTASRGLWVWTRWCANTWATALFPAAMPSASVCF